MVAKKSKPRKRAKITTPQAPSTITFRGQTYRHFKDTYTYGEAKKEARKAIAKGHKVRILSNIYSPTFEIGKWSIYVR